MGLISAFFGDYSEMDWYKAQQQKPSPPAKSNVIITAPEESVTTLKYPLPNPAKPNFHGNWSLENCYRILKRKDPIGRELVDTFLHSAYTHDGQSWVRSTGNKGFFEINSTSMFTWNLMWGPAFMATLFAHEAQHVKDSWLFSNGLGPNLAGVGTELSAFKEQARCARAIGRPDIARWCEKQNGRHIYDRTDYGGKEQW